MPQRTQINPGKAGPKGALAEKPPGKPTGGPRSGPPGAEGNNTRRDFVRLPKHRKKKGEGDRK
jgi:hypothetical protein